MAWATPPLTTIQDMLYRADGTPFNGVAFIEWRSFRAADDSNIAPHSLVAPIVNGVLKVELVPTTNALTGASYTVRYNSDGRIQFEETWAVPPSGGVLRLKDVRVTATGGTAPAPVTAPIQETDVAGLPADLAIRPVKGPGYVPGRAAFINADGALEGVSGEGTDCVRVDGTSAPCGPRFVDGETPSGEINGTNGEFSLAEAPEPASSLGLYRNGLRLKEGVDYVLTGNAISFLIGAIPQPGDSLTASYRAPVWSEPMAGIGGAALLASLERARLGLSPAALAPVSRAERAARRTAVGVKPLMMAGGRSETLAPATWISRSGSGHAALAGTTADDAALRLATSPGPVRRGAPASTGSPRRTGARAPGREEAVGRADDEGAGLGAPAKTPEIVCSGAGMSARSTAMARLGACAVRVEAGDRIEVRLDFTHEGNESGFEVETLLNGAPVVRRRFGARESAVAVRADVTGGTGSIQSWGVVSRLESAGKRMAEVLGPIVLEFRGRLGRDAAGGVALRNFVVIRYAGVW